MTADRGRIFLDTLSAPEHVWLNFFREFFSQATLLYETTGRPLPNRFFLDLAKDPSNRPFDVVLAADYDDSKQNALPQLVVEDASGATQLGLAIGQLQTWKASPQARKDRTDQIRFTYVFHCLSKNRGESRMLASIVGTAITLFKDAIQAFPGMIMIQPWSIGATQPLRSDSAEDYVDTPVQVTFTMIEFWHTLELGDIGGTAESFCISFAGDSSARYVSGFMSVADPEAARYINAKMTLVNPNAAGFVDLSMSVADPISKAAFINIGATVQDALTVARFIGASMRVS